jgi:hypothetical protein
VGFVLDEEAQATVLEDDLTEEEGREFGVVAQVQAIFHGTLLSLANRVRLSIRMGRHAMNGQVRFGGAWLKYKG